MIDDVNIHKMNKTLKNFKFPQPASYAERFAQERFLKKFEEPDSAKTASLKEQAWVSFLERDSVLDKPDILRLYPGPLYKARQKLAEMLVNLPAIHETFLPKGSEFYSTRGRNSIEARLTSSRWSVTRECFDDFFIEVCNNHSLKIALKKRFNAKVRQTEKISIHEINQKLWLTCDSPLEILRHKLMYVTELEYGSRFSTVPKNNKVRRPINIENFGNIIVQRKIGAQLRSVIKSNFYDLDTLAENHATRIQDPNIATIDFSNASDSMSLALIKFLVPNRFFERLCRARSEMILGPDGCYHYLNKISSMGNGFTFELMSLVLVAIARVFDPTASVFGDDVIIKNTAAQDFIDVCTSVGFNVNSDKTFINSEFRESCGANWLDGYGYIESYDFTWITNPGEFIVTLNKLYRLCFLYPSFMALRNVAMRQIPAAMQRGPSDWLDNQNFYMKALHSRDKDGKPVYDFPSYIVSSRIIGDEIKQRHVINYLKALQYNPKCFRIVRGVKFNERLRSGLVRDMSAKRHWAKYKMYLHAGRTAKDVIANDGDWVFNSFLVSSKLTIRMAELPKDYCLIT